MSATLVERWAEVYAQLREPNRPLTPYLEANTRAIVAALLVVADELETISRSIEEK
jgi:hypothetical protein